MGVPAKPTSVVLTRGSGDMLNLTWVNNATGPNPYTHVEMQRTNSATVNWYGTVVMAGSSTSYSGQGDDDRIYKLRVRATNSSGASAWVESNPQSTTPGKPGKPVANKNGAGDFVLTYAAASSKSSTVQFEFWHAADGVWDLTPLGTASWTSTTYTHSSPDPAKTHVYRLRAVSTNPVLYGAYGDATGFVPLIQPPAAPSNLSPNGAALDASKPITESWAHNATDTTPQSAYEVQGRTNGGSWVTTGKVVSSNSSRAIAGGTWTNGDLIEWQVRTWGAHATAGPWSATATINLATAPTAAVNSPDGYAPYGSSQLVVAWGYFQAEGRVQVGWQVRLKLAGNVIETLAGAGAELTATFATPLRDATTYEWSVRVQASDGQWSGWDAVSFTVAYAKPPTPDGGMPDFAPDFGSVSIPVHVPAPGVGQVAAVSTQVWRSTDGVWVLVADNLPTSTVAVDTTPPLNSYVSYRVVAISALPSQSETVASILTDGGSHLWINGGDGFSQSIKLAANVVVDMTRGRVKELHDFGRPSGKPVEFAGTALSRTVGVAADLWRNASIDQSAWEDIEDLAILSGPHCYRDLDGRRFFVSMSQASISGLGSPSKRGIGFTLTEIDWNEPREAD